MRIEQGEHISYPPKFENIDAWQLARELTYKVNERRITLNL
jgi:hypothetical protein